MKPFITNATEITPQITLNKEKSIFIIEGKSLPEDVKFFYAPVIEWFESYIRNPNEDTNIILDFEYFNTASSKMILIMLSKFRELIKNGKKVTVTWRFPKNDQELEEAGVEFSEILNLPFSFIPK